MKRLALIMAVGAIALLAASPAFGQGAVGDTYGGDGNDALPTIQDNGDSGGTAGDTAAGEPTQVAVTSDAGSSLPFTGLDVGLLVLGGIALVGIGVGLRRFARPLT
ncbi:MAG: hypothetical protein GXY03_12665 [Solirubrobacterales bacterium]|nr:hypothetical protein [Solirubrobacterales bacterium]